MHPPLIQEQSNEFNPEQVVERLRGLPGVVLLRSASPDSAQARYSFVAARPFLTFRSFGSRCEITAHAARRTPHVSPSVARVCFGDPWRVLEAWLSRYELPDEPDLPFPLGGCFGYWGYDLKNFVEPRLPRRAVRDVELPDCHVGFYDTLVVFDHHLGRSWIVSTGLQVDGTRSAEHARRQLELWEHDLTNAAPILTLQASRFTAHAPRISSNLTRAGFSARVERALDYIRAGDIYQVNLAQRLAAPRTLDGWELFQRLSAVSPAPFAAFLDFGDWQLVSSSPELFLRLSGRHILTRPIKGTRPRDLDATRDAQLTYELQTSTKDMAELVMITDLLRNDLGRVCDYGSVQVPELVRLERYAQVQHLVSTVEGRLRPEVTHLAALAACFPGGSITGAPKIRAMEIIDALEPATRGPYTGCLGYLGFNRESLLSIVIRSALCTGAATYFHVGAGIVADSVPAAEYEETLAKAAGFLGALGMPAMSTPADGFPDRITASPGAG
ncbi:MAG: aminodeoxychorismate synthase component I [Verrucomicrobia bacterium]|nr:aminodeoxychorismate synthase component I [Verrucomicrobiota bacterium]